MNGANVMKRRARFLSRWIFLLLLATMMLTLPADILARGPGYRGGQGLGTNSGSPGGMVSLILEYPHQDIDESEIADLFYMLEEEKLARDVYLTLYDIWGEPIFFNIAESEDRHHQMVEVLLNKYELYVPDTEDGIGMYENPVFVQLYDQLVEAGSMSFEDAVRVGATIEDLDIYDLEDALEQTDNIDIRTVFQNLMKGSRNHLRSFYYQMELLGIVYEAQYLTQDQIDAILDHPMERGMVDSDGNLIGFIPRLRTGPKNRWGK